MAVIEMTPAVRAHLQRLEPSAAKSHLTLEALDRWAQCTDDFERDFARDRAGQREVDPPLAPGLNVWVRLPRHDVLGHPGYLVRGRLIKRNNLMCTWLVLNTDAPRLHFYIGADKILPRTA